MNSPIEHFVDNDGKSINNDIFMSQKNNSFKNDSFDPKKNSCDIEVSDCKNAPVSNILIGNTRKNTKYDCNKYFSCCCSITTFCISSFVLLYKCLINIANDTPPVTVINDNNLL